MTRTYLLALAAAAAAAAAMPGAAQAQTLPAVELTRNALPDDPETGRIETVRANLAGPIGTWKGVRSCSRASRARDAMQAAFDRWIGQQTMARPGKLLITHGWQPGKWWYKNKTSSSGKRSCKGGFHTAPVYARFY